MPDEPKTKDDIKNMLKHLEDEYRKANITEKTYKELKERYKQQMSYMDNTISAEDAQQAAPTADEGGSEEQTEEKKKSGGLLGKLRGKKDKKQEEAAAAPAAEPEAASEAQTVEIVENKQASDGSGAKAMAAVQQLSIELEKLKVMIEAGRDQKKSTDESVQSLFEGIGEIRSMSIQNDATSRELISKLERIEDDVNNLRPKELEKKFNQANEILDKHQLLLEKTQAKTDDMTERLNKVYETVRLIGNTENLANINQNVQKKLNDIREATNYVERLASKAEKIFIDLKMELEDLVVFKAKQEALEESIKDILKNLDAIGVKFEGYSTKRDLDEEKQDIMILNKEQETIKNAMAIVQSNVPEPILQLRKEREDIKLFLDALDEQIKDGKIKMVDYETAKKKNMDKLKGIDSQLLAEWKKFEKILTQIPKEEARPIVNIVESAPEAPAKEENSESNTDEEQDAEENNAPSAEPETAPAQEQAPVVPKEPATAALVEDEKKGFLGKIMSKRKKEEEITGESDVTTNRADPAKSEEPAAPVAAAETQTPAAQSAAQTSLEKKPDDAQQTDQKPAEKKPRKKKIEVSMPF